MAQPKQAMQAQTARQLRLLANGSYSTGKGNAQNDYIWDRFLMPATPAPQGTPLFRIPKNGAYGTVAGDAKTDIETSMDDNGKLAAGQNFLSNAICPHLITTNNIQSSGDYVHHLDRVLQAWKVWQQHTNWTFKFSNTEYSWRAPGVIFLPANYEVGASAAYLANEHQVQAAFYNHLSWMNMPTRLPITEQVNFSIITLSTSGSASILVLLQNAMAFLNNATAGGTPTAVQCEVQCTLRGLLTRAI